jgi:L-ascorbate metabolism protein UlaG (beta-lactamase superfamily)
MKKIIPSMLLAALSVAACAQSFPHDNFTTKDGKPLTIYFVKHASLVIKYDDKLIYVDPVTTFADFSKEPKADVILITHEHGDHFDTLAIKQLEKPETKIILNPATYEILGKGFSMINFAGVMLAEGVSLLAVPAYNVTPDRIQFHPKGRDNGYVLNVHGTKIYIAGDTEPIFEMALLKDIDIAFLPVNQPYTMTVEQAVAAAQVIKPKILYPYHFGETNVQEVANYLGGTGIEVRIRALE